MKLCWALVSFYPCHDLSIFHSLHPKDISSGNSSAREDTEIRVATLSATFERQCKFYVCRRACVAPDSSATVSRTSTSESVSDHIIATHAPQPMGIDLYVDGYIAQMFQPEGAAAYFGRLLQVGLRTLRFISSAEWSSAFLIYSPQVSYARPFTTVKGHPAWLLDFAIRPFSTVVQQRIWAPQNEAQRHTHAPLNMPIFFVLSDGVTLGLPIVSAASRDHMTLRGAGTPAPVGECSSIFIRINVSTDFFNPVARVHLVAGRSWTVLT